MQENHKIKLLKVLIFFIYTDRLVLIVKKRYLKHSQPGCAGAEEGPRQLGEGRQRSRPWGGGATGKAQVCLPPRGRPLREGDPAQGPFS